MYANFVIRRLVRSGYTASRAKELLESKAYPAKQALEAEIKERPIIYNRAPSLWRYNIVAAYPKLVKGKTIKVNPLVENGMNLDYDGDALQLHLPATDKGVADSRKMTLSNLLFSDKKRNDLLVFPQHEAIIGIFQATSAKPTGKKVEFKTKKDAGAGTG
jgi:DNA-directed RNA polymerase subunit beta'